jgi:hypothetical protein
MRTKLLLLVFTVVFITANLYSADFTVDGIAYTITSAVSPYAVAVSSKTIAYKDAVTIPATVSYNSISYGVTSIGNAAFSACYYLTSIVIPSSVTSIGSHAFAYCSGLTSITIPNSVTSIGSYAYYHCTGLTSVTIPNSVTSIGDYAFHQCSVLTSVTIPSSVTSIGVWTFKECISLTSITIPSSVTSIGDAAFNGCTSLTSITIPSTVTSIGDGAFSYCSGLTSIYADSPTPIDLSSSTYVFYNVNKTTCTLYVPTGSKSLYAAVNQWKDFTKIEEHIVTGMDESVAANGIISVLQNYPNPFNTTTTIKYKVSEPGFVSLKVFDVMGTEVAALVNEKKPVGEYSIDWNASKLRSGIFFCRLQSGTFSQTKKLVLQK